ncbi:MAG: hypothetical protein K8I27_04345 [Planctomycetes bacterium]|nr:hypothetical protein [Planctomycetota bacterium]
MSKSKSAGRKATPKSAKKSVVKSQKKAKVAIAAETPVKNPKKPRPTGMAAEPTDVDEYEVMRQAAVEPYRRDGKAPKPGAAGRLFDSEEDLEDYDPLFDEVGEEEDE